MSDQVRALKDKATELTTKGKFPAAIEAWQKVVAAAPDDVGALQKVAEVMAKAGKKADALKVYEDVADRYAKHGLFFKASAVCRVILSLEPGHSQTQEKIASLFARATAPKAPVLPPKAQVPPPPPKDAVAPVEIDLEIEVETEPPATRSGLPSIPLFSTLTEAELKEILSTAMEVRSYKAGETIIAEGAPGDSMFAMAEGEAGIFRGFGTPQQRRVASANAGDILGEVAMVSGSPRVASVVADVDTVALEITRDAMANVVTNHPRVKQMLIQFYRERLLANALRASPLLRALPEADKKALSTSFRPGAYPDGATIIQEGQPSEFVQLVLRGTCAASHRSGERYPDLREGDLFGEVSMLTNGVATATVTALGPVLTLKLSAQDLKARVLQDSAAMLAVKKLAQARLARTAKLDAQTLEEADLVEDTRV